MPLLYIYQDVSLQRRNSNLHVEKKKARRGTKLFVNKLKRIKIKLYSDFLFTVIESKLYIFLLLIMTEFFNN